MFRNFYRDFGDGRSVDCWNAVDVQRDDGFLQHGTVVDVLSTGLLIDFGYSGQRDHFIRSGLAYGLPENTEVSWPSIPVGMEVLVLLRETFDGPWVWYPAKLLTTFDPVPDDSLLVLIGLELSGVYREEIVPTEQPRMPQSSADLEARIIHAGYFDRRECALPDCGDWTSAADGIALKLFPHTLSRRYDAHLIHLNEKHLVYLQRAVTAPLDSSKLKMVIDGAPMKILWNRVYGLHYLGDGRWGCPTVLRTVLVAERDPEEWGVLNLLHVAKDILGEVLQYVASMERAQYRRVCQSFNCILNNKTRFTDIVIRYRNCPGDLFRMSLCRRCGSHVREYSVVAPLVKCMTSYVQRIIITAEHEGLDFLAIPSILNALQGLYTLHRADRQLSTLVAGNCSFFAGDAFFHSDVNNFAKNLQATRGMCTKLLLYKCGVNIYVGDVNVSIACISGTVKTSSAEKDFWDVVESNLPAVDIQPAAEWVSRAVLEQSDDRGRIADILNHFTGDPRPSSVYGSQVWTMENLGALDVTKLSALCRYILSRCGPHNPDQRLPIAEEQ